MIEAEEAVDSARTKIADAVEAVRDDQEASGEAERERQTWHPAYRAA